MIPFATTHASEVSSAAHNLMTTRFNKAHIVDRLTRNLVTSAP